MNKYMGLSKEDLMIEQEVLREQLSFHAHADRWSPREVEQKRACEFNLALISDEWDRREAAGKEVNHKLDVLKDRWTPKVNKMYDR